MTIPILRSAAAAATRSPSNGDSTPIAYLTPEERYVEKLATPDVTIADLIGDIDPIKAARGGHELSSEMTVHYGLVPRANRGIFAINELPDLAGKIQVGLFNIMQEGDVQIKGYPIRLPLDIALVFSANPEDYTARGKDRHPAERPHWFGDSHPLSRLQSKKESPSPRRKRGHSATDTSCRFRSMCRKSSSASPLRLAKTRKSTNAPE